MTKNMKLSDVIAAADAANVPTKRGDKITTTSAARKGVKRPVKIVAPKDATKEDAAERALIANAIAAGERAAAAQKELDVADKLAAELVAAEREATAETAIAGHVAALRKGAESIAAISKRGGQELRDAWVVVGGDLHGIRSLCLNKKGNPDNVGYNRRLVSAGIADNPETGARGLISNRNYRPAAIELFGMHDSEPMIWNLISKLGDGQETDKLDHPQTIVRWFNGNLTSLETAIAKIEPDNDGLVSRDMAETMLRGDNKSSALSDFFLALSQERTDNVMERAAIKRVAAIKAAGETATDDDDKSGDDDGETAAKTTVTSFADRTIDDAATHLLLTLKRHGSASDVLARLNELFAA